MEQNSSENSGGAIGFYHQ
ncbi:hypothetical protein [Chryseobacterium sp. StRB126]